MGGVFPESVYKKKEEKNHEKRQIQCKFWETVPFFDDIKRPGVSEVSVSISNFALTEDSEDPRPKQRIQHAPEDDDESCYHFCHNGSDDHGD